MLPYMPYTIAGHLYHEKTLTGYLYLTMFNQLHSVIDTRQYQRASTIVYILVNAICYVLYSKKLQHNPFQLIMYSIMSKSNCSINDRKDKCTKCVQLDTMVRN